MKFSRFILQHIKSLFSRQIQLGLVSIIMILVSSCVSADYEQTITFKQGGKWEMVANVIVPSDELVFPGASAEIESNLDTVINDIESLGASASWNSSQREQNTVYTLNITGDDHNALTTMMEGQLLIEEIDHDSETRYGITIRPDVDFDETTYTLIGGDIVSGNGIEIEPGIMQWMNPLSSMEVVLTEKRVLPISSIVSAFATLVAVSLVWFAVRSGITQRIALPRLGAASVCPNCNTPLEKSVHFCEECGHNLSVTTGKQCKQCETRRNNDAQFCDNCGTPQHNLPVAMPTCVNCNASLDKTAVFCTECGTKVPQNE